MSTGSHAGSAIVQSLEAHGVTRVFCVPGESFLAVLDGLHETSIATIVSRHEGGAAYMAEAHGKFTGIPGVAIVTRGPGAANAFVAVHTAWQDGTPLVLFVGMIPTADRMRGAFQEFDPYAWFGTQTKRVFVLDEPHRASEVVAEAFFAASSGRPGPVIVGLPEDVVQAPFDGVLHAPLPVTKGAFSAADTAAINEEFAAARRPLLFLGGQRWTPKAADEVTRFAEQHRIPVLHDWRASDRVPFSSEVNAGWLGYGRPDTAAAIFDSADLVLAVGDAPSDVATDGYTLRQRASARNVLVTPDSSLRGRSGPVNRHVLASPEAFGEIVDELYPGRSAARDRWCREARAAHTEDSRPPLTEELPATSPGTAHMGAVMAELIRHLDQEVVTTFGAGNHCLWAQKYMPTETFPSQLSTRNGSMGYSIPAAVSAALEDPSRMIVTVCGDGEFLMNGQELATAAQYGAAFLVLVMDNAEYGTIRAHQEHHYPDRVSGTQLSNPDFAGMAQTLGGEGLRIDDDTQITDAVNRAIHTVRDKQRFVVLHIIVDQAHALP